MKKTFLFISVYPNWLIIRKFYLNLQIKYFINKPSTTKSYYKHFYFACFSEYVVTQQPPKRYIHKVILTTKKTI